MKETKSIFAMRGSTWSKLYGI